MKKTKLIILGGNVSNNIPWLKKMSKAYAKDYDVEAIYYDHWKSNNKISFDLELAKLKKIDKESKDYYILAKSVGSLISLIGVEKQIVKPKGLIILGFPLRYLENNNIDISESIISAVKQTTILLIQQKNDPIGSYNEVIKQLPANIKVIEIPGNNHIYGNINKIKSLTEEFIKHLF